MSFEGERRLGRYGGEKEEHIPLFEDFPNKFEIHEFFIKPNEKPQLMHREYHICNLHPPLMIEYYDLFIEKVDENNIGKLTTLIENSHILETGIETNTTKTKILQRIPIYNSEIKPDFLEKLLINNYINPLLQYKR